MSRIKYPGEQEMKRQIQVILDESGMFEDDEKSQGYTCLLYTSPSPRDVEESRMPSSA